MCVYITYLRENNLDPDLQCFHKEFTIIAFFIGTIPGPSIFKMSGENSCIFRDVNECGYTGRCWIYNKTRMAYLFVGICK